MGIWTRGGRVEINCCTIWANWPHHYLHCLCYNIIPLDVRILWYEFLMRNVWRGKSLFFSFSQLWQETIKNQGENKFCDTLQDTLWWSKFYPIVLGSELRSLFWFHLPADARWDLGWSLAHSKLIHIDGFLVCIILIYSHTQWAFYMIEITLD